MNVAKEELKKTCFKSEEVGGAIDCDYMTVLLIKMIQIDEKDN